MANHALAERPQNLVGEIIEGRYAVLELLGANRYLVYDMKELRQTVMPLSNRGAVVDFNGPAAPTQVAAAAAKPPTGPLPRLAPLRGRSSLPPLPGQTRARPPSAGLAPLPRSNPPPLPEEARAATAALVKEAAPRSAAPAPAKQAAPTPPPAAKKPLFRVVTDPQVPFDTRLRPLAAEPATAVAPQQQAARAPLALTQHKAAPPPPVALTQRKQPLPLKQVKTRFISLQAAQRREGPALLQQQSRTQLEQPLVALAPTRPPRRDATPMPPLQRRRVDTHRFEAAWFSYGEQLQNEEPAAEEVTDYAAYQSYLERIALEQA